MTTHPAFFTRPNYRLRASLTEYRAAASAARAAGHYNLSTLWLFRQCWRQSHNLLDYLKYLAFRRDLGYPLTQRQQDRIQHWYMHSLQFLCWKLTHPSGAALLGKLQKTTPGQPVLEQQFRAYLQQTSNIQLVGNSAELTGAGLGNAIESADTIIRFNQCFGPRTQATDTGHKTTIWVGAPDFNLAPPTANWYIMSGPDMLAWITKYPSPFKGIHPVLSVPLAVWRKLVRQLGAPPSAGLLIICWLQELAPNCPKLICGFSFKSNAKHYHHAVPLHQAVPRHNWLAEKRLLQQWLDNQLIRQTFKQ